MRVVGLAVAGMIALSAPVAGHAAPSASSMKPFAPGNGIIRVWGGCGWHPVPGHWSRWRGGWVPAHGAPSRYYGGWRDYGGWVRTALGKAPTEIGVLMPIGEAPTKASIVPVELTLQRFGSIPHADDSSPLS